MKKLIFLAAIAVLLFSAAGCGGRGTNQANSEAGHELPQSKRQDDGTKEAPAEETPMSQDVYGQAMEKWEALGGSFDFKEIEGIDTETLVRLYSYYGIYTGAFDYGADWIGTAGFDRFVKDFFDLAPEPFHQDFPGVHPVNYDSEKGFRFYVRTSLLPDNAKHQMTDFGGNGDGTYFFTYQTTFELPRELVPEGESTVERTTKVSFRYADERICFVKASYQQDGRVLS